MTWKLQSLEWSNGAILWATANHHERLSVREMFASECPLSLVLCVLLEQHVFQTQLIGGNAPHRSWWISLENYPHRSRGLGGLGCNLLEFCRQHLMHCLHFSQEHLQVFIVYWCPIAWPVVWLMFEGPLWNLHICSHSSDIATATAHLLLSRDEPVSSRQAAKCRSVYSIGATENRRWNSRWAKVNKTWKIKR